MPSAKPNEKVFVQITAEETVTYSQIKEMTVDEWAKIKAMLDDEEAIEAGNSVLEEWIDKRDVFDGNGFEVTGCMRVDEDGKAVKPMEGF